MPSERALLRMPFAMTKFALQIATPTAWLDAVLGNFDAFLLDHASCERKASAFALAMVAHFRDKSRLVTTMIDLALEELGHFRQVVQILEGRALHLGPDRRAPYVRALGREVRQGSESYLVDRLIVGGIIEARGCERFGRIATLAEIEARLVQDLTPQAALH